MSQWKRIAPSILGGVILFLAGGPAYAQSAGALELPPRIVRTPAAAEPVATPPGDQVDERAEVSAPVSEDQPSAAANLPYLGVSVQYMESDDTPGAEVHGLQVVRVDPDSPAEKAGLRGQGQVTRMGASGATAGEMMPPLNLIIMPLLKKAGKLGDDGDLIVAIDDDRVDNAHALDSALAPLKPGDTLYLTIVRFHQDGKHETLKVPIRLGLPHSASGAVN